MYRMRNRVLIFCGVIAVLGLVVGSGAAQVLSEGGDGASSEKDAVLAANVEFVASLNAMLAGDAKPFAEVWSHSDDVIYMGADGKLNVGWDATYANWKKQAAIQIGGKVEASDVRVTLGKELAIVSNLVSQVDANLPVKTKLRATSVYQKQDGKWKMIRHHVDVVPALRKRMDSE